jgi:hypothetical protein
MSETTPVSGHSGDDKTVLAAAVKSALSGIPEKIEGVQAQLNTLKDEDLARALADFAKLKGTVEGLQSLKDEIPADQSEKIASMAAQLDGISAQLQSGVAGPGGKEAPKSLGEVIHEAEGFQAMISDQPSPTRAYKISLSKYRSDESVMSIPDLLSGKSAAPVLTASAAGAVVVQTLCPIKSARIPPPSGVMR